MIYTLFVLRDKRNIVTRCARRRVSHITTFLPDRVQTPQIVALYPTEATDFFWEFLEVIFLADLKSRSALMLAKIKVAQIPSI